VICSPGPSLTDAEAVTTLLLPSPLADPLAVVCPLLPPLTPLVWPL